ncbi:MAG TPA: YcaO-like family protein [Labilithrix sp.]|nr:YcaO-like family protein [Labilithrix sp.]
MFRLPEGWSAPEVVEDVIVADHVAIHRAGLSTIAEGGEEVCGAAAGCGGSALSRAWFELLERVSGLEAIRMAKGSYRMLTDDGDLSGTMAAADIFPESDAPEQWRYARSNGVALHADWNTACRRARWELAERDRVIRSWHGEIRPTPVPFEGARTPLAGAKSFEWLAYSFPEDDVSSFSHGVEVVGVFGFPRQDAAPFVLGLAGRGTLGDAFDAAASEALQLLAFLWGEPIPETPPTDPGPMQHLDTYQVRGAHERVRRWLSGDHVGYWTSRPRVASQVAYVDLTPSWLPGDLRVAKAVCKEATPLVFGESPFAAHLPAELRRHPIP